MFGFKKCQVSSYVTLKEFIAVSVYPPFLTISSFDISLESYDNLFSKIIGHMFGNTIHNRP